MNFHDKHEPTKYSSVTKSDESQDVKTELKSTVTTKDDSNGVSPFQSSSQLIQHEMNELSLKN